MKKWNPAVQPVGKSRLSIGCKDNVNKGFLNSHNIPEEYNWPFDNNKNLIT